MPTTPTNADPTTDPDADVEIDSFGISLPDHWFMLPLHRPDFDRTVDGLRRAWREEGMSRTDQRRGELLLARIRNRLRDEGINFIAASFELGFRPGVEEIDANAEALMVACTFSTLTQADLETDVRLSIPVLYGAFTSKGGPKNEAIRITDLEPPEVCELSAGRAVRMRRLYEPTAVKQRGERWYAETFVMPVGTSGRMAGVLQFSTTNVGLAGEFSGLFADFAQTMTFFGPDDPTVMNVVPDDDAASGMGVQP